ncbi:hypothetical protein [Pseudomonas sp. PS01301]|uniref:hypothetical protein n=1 Tax=Pseudomonas sp. PS01301 TaxID=2991437 RepID=UPI00249B1F85|nr:hypothetical protein [Pseudomonas sp. PS01301]
METSPEGVYCNTLVAVFGAAFKLGFDPYALAVQAKIDVARYLEMPPMKLSESVERVIDESLLVAKLINERWPTYDLNDCDEEHARPGRPDDYSDIADDGPYVAGRARG